LSIVGIPRDQANHFPEDGANPEPYSAYLNFLLEVSQITRYIAELEAMGYSLSSAPNKVSVVIARRRNLPFLFFFPLWVAGWVTLALKGTRNSQPQSIFGEIFSGIVTLSIAYAWLWNLGGKEELEFTASALTYRRTLFGISHSRVFSMKRIDNPHFENSQSRGKSRIPSGIGFSYEGKEIRVGDHLTCRDAKEIIGAVLLQLPELARYWGWYKEGFLELDEDMSLNLK
jgi:hypothetical protein